MHSASLVGGFEYQMLLLAITFNFYAAKSRSLAEVLAGKSLPSAPPSGKDKTWVKYSKYLHRATQTQEMPEISSSMQL